MPLGKCASCKRQSWLCSIFSVSWRVSLVSEMRCAVRERVSEQVMLLYLLPLLPSLCILIDNPYPLFIVTNFANPKSKRCEKNRKFAASHQKMVKMAAWKMQPITSPREIHLLVPRSRASTASRRQPNTATQAAREPSRTTFAVDPPQYGGVSPLLEDHIQTVTLTLLLVSRND